MASASTCQRFLCMREVGAARLPRLWDRHGAAGAAGTGEEGRRGGPP
jgi:hypothetical protein